MDHRNKNSRRHWNNKRFDKKEKIHISEEEQKNQDAIKALKQNAPECPKCHQPVTELATALADKAKPINCAPMGFIFGAEWRDITKNLEKL